MSVLLKLLGTLLGADKMLGSSCDKQATEKESGSQEMSV